MKSWDNKKEDRVSILISKIMKFFILVLKECFFIEKRTMDVFRYVFIISSILMFANMIGKCFIRSS